MCTIILVYLFSSQEISTAQLAYQHKEKGVVASLHYKVDTVYVPVPVDTMKFFVLSKESVPKETWWQRNEGTFLGSALAAIVAFLTVLFTNYFSSQQTKRKSKEAYCALLAAIYSELMGHDNLSVTLKKELEELLSVVEQTGDILSSPFTYFPLEFLNECRIKATEFQTTNVGLLSYISHYINVVSWFHKNLDFTQLGRMRAYFPNQADYPKAIINYFRIVFHHFEKLEKSRKILSELLEKEISLSSSGKINIVEEFNKKMGV